MEATVKKPNSYVKTLSGVEVVSSKMSVLSLVIKLNRLAEISLLKNLPKFMESAQKIVMQKN